MINEKIGHYRITGMLGQGGMGEVYAARDEKLNRTVAVKVIAGDAIESDASRRLFLREARAAAALNHPFICAVHDVLEHAGQPVIIMERVEGETLSQRIFRGALPPEEIVRITLEIAEALAAAHGRGIIHRDIKSANIMLTTGGHVKVMDFGLAMVTQSSPEEQTAHKSEESASIVGTLPYLAPELLTGETASEATDIYALGVVMYEVATGRRPFTGKTNALIIVEILNHLPVPPRQLNAAIPRDLNDLILLALNKNPERRPSLADLRSALTTKTRSRQQSLAILPFQSLTHDAENAHLGLALADAVTSELALVRSLLVRPTAAILRYEGKDPVTAARELGVDAVVAGTVQRSGSRLRVTVQMVSAAEERPLWSIKIDTALDDIFAMQDEVSRKVVEALQLELSPADEKRLLKRPQVSGDLLDLWLKGRLALLHETVPDVNASIEFFEKAHKIDPSKPLPLLGLADAYNRLAITWDPDGGWYERAREACDRALQLEPDIPEGRYISGSLAWTPQGGFDHEYAIREIAAALEERPNLNEAFDFLAKVLFHVGLLEEATNLYARAMAINPEDTQALTHLSTAAALGGDFVAARQAARAVSEQDDTSWNRYMAIMAELHCGDHGAAEAMLENARRKFPGMVLFHSAAAVLASLRRDEQAARQAISRTLKQRREFAHFHHAEFDIACALAILGHSAEALEHLTAAARNGFPCWPSFTSEPFLASLRHETGYRDLISELHETRDRFARIYNDVKGSFTSSS